MSLVPCSSCGCHARLSDNECPHCGAAMVQPDGSRKRTAAALVAGLTLVGFARNGTANLYAPEQLV